MACSKPCLPSQSRASAARPAAFAQEFPLCKIADLNLDGRWCKEEEQKEKKCGVIERVSYEADIICVDESHAWERQRQAVTDFASANQLIPYFALREGRELRRPKLQRQLSRGGGITSVFSMATKRHDAQLRRTL